MKVIICEMIIFNDQAEPLTTLSFQVFWLAQPPPRATSGAHCFARAGPTTPLPPQATTLPATRPWTTTAPPKKPLEATALATALLTPTLPQTTPVSTQNWLPFSPTFPVSPEKTTPSLPKFQKLLSHAKDRSQAVRFEDKLHKKNSKNFILNSISIHFR